MLLYVTHFECLENLNFVHTVGLSRTLINNISYQVIIIQRPNQTGLSQDQRHLVRTPQPVSMAVLMEPPLRSIIFPMSSMYASAPFENMVPPPGKTNRSPLKWTQFCFFFSTVSSLCGTLANHALSRLSGHWNGAL